MNQDVTNQLPAEVKKQTEKKNKLKSKRETESVSEWVSERDRKWSFFKDKMNMCDKIYYRNKKWRSQLKKIKNYEQKY